MPQQSEGRSSARGRCRLPMALAVISAAVLYLFLPGALPHHSGRVYVYPTFLLVLLGADPEDPSHLSSAALAASHDR